MHRSYFKVWLIKTLILQKVYFLGPVIDETIILSEKTTVKTNLSIHWVFKKSNNWQEFKINKFKNEHRAQVPDTWAINLQKYYIRWINKLLKYYQIFIDNLYKL